MNLLLAFSAGLLSFFSPCVLPLIPVYLSYLIGSTATDIQTEETKKLLWRAILFILGFSFVFILLGVSVSSVSRLVSEHLQIVMRFGGLLIILFGLQLTGVLRIKLLYSDTRFAPKRTQAGALGAVVLGMAFAAGWTPCIGPILSSILIYASSMSTIGKGVLLLTAYSLGMAVPLLMSALLVDHMRRILRKISRFLPAISIVSGVVMIVMGVLMYTNRLESIVGASGLLNL
ncbi:cytochrome c biogenesis protein CcdA [Cohnella endophytica]|uniref:Cytochrome c biogenesis protein CcdA n=1 Tax=Cohnella endophytica TaxID=2419778 RepID=A0A494XGY3_9BACL|nr:cytochrome c biogenesis protein CcdA [Cohnella endophytica]RKP50005.1 cytochrome c biogenesis protein CcdA [Cohnella endophytica]